MYISILYKPAIYLGLQAFTGTQLRYTYQCRKESMVKNNKENAMSRALLVIDVQNEYFPGGALPITHPAGHLGQILKAMDAAEGRVPTLVVQHHFPDPAMPFFQKGTLGWELHPEVADRPRDLLVEKTLPGSFTNTNLENWLREHDVNTVTIAGYMTHMCCDTTARQAVHRGLTVEFLQDATGTLALENSAGKVTAEELHRSILCAQQMLLSEVLDLDSWIARL
ncbi:Streptothricin hydrolase [Bythopirellula goksoeyrii]|uniref:Streptothricin hydrolase n=2 Tax=Bythopirellula goksoeyrii TaxID=1400387 RepID=A0A5B9Q1I3_9BACT|nr:Streptothricin hydrolase [Bythopirellula goksoeyrii]